MQKVLIIEDDLDTANILEAYLKKERFHTLVASDGQRGLELALRWEPNLILLDIVLPALSGMEILVELRRNSEIPVIMLSSPEKSAGAINALRFGADDYVLKPYNPTEISARVHAVLRRTSGIHKVSFLKYAEIRVDTASYKAWVVNDKGKEFRLKLTPTELTLLILFISYPQKAFSRQALLEACHPESEAFERVVDTHIYNLRKKLEQAGQYNIITNIRGIGYRLRDA